MLNSDSRSRLGGLSVWDDRKFERYGALGGVWFVVLAVTGAAIGGSFPSRSDSPAEITKWYVDNDSAIQVGAFLTGIGIIGIVWWFGSLWQAGRRADDSARLTTIALAGFVFSGAVASGSFALNAAIASRIDQIGEGSAIFFEISGVMLAMGSIGDVIVAVAISALAMRSGFLPRPVVWLGLTVAVTSLIASAGLASDADFFSVFSLVAFVVWALWILATSIHLFRTNA